MMAEPVGRTQNGLHGSQTKNSNLKLLTLPASSEFQIYINAMHHR